MLLNVSILSVSLALAGSWIAPASELPAGSELRAGTHHFEAIRIAGGDFVRMPDGMEPATVVITGQNGLIVDGGRFRTAKPRDYTRGIKLARGKSISLYN